MLEHKAHTININDDHCSPRKSRAFRILDAYTSFSNRCSVSSQRFSLISVLAAHAWFSSSSSRCSFCVVSIVRCDFPLFDPHFPPKKRPIQIIIMANFIVGLWYLYMNV